MAAIVKKEENEDEEKWLKHYASFHEILLVGDGDFSFSLCLAKSFGSASNMVATSLDSYDFVIRKYKNAKSNLEMLKELGACIYHGVDATKMKFHTDLRMRKFDRIIFNFPHAGFHGKEDSLHLIEKHRTLVYEFFKNSSGMLRADGEVHVNHKTTSPFSKWNLVELAEKNYLLLIERVDFKIEDYSGYNNKRGDSARCDESFPLGESSTFKFRFFRAIKSSIGLNNIGSVHTRSQKSREDFASMKHQPPPLTPVLPMHINIRNDYSRIFALRLGFARYITEDPRRTLYDYINVLESFTVGASQDQHG